MSKQALLTWVFIFLTLVVVVLFLRTLREDEPLSSEVTVTDFATITVREDKPSDFRDLVSGSVSPEQEVLLENIFTDQYYLKSCTIEGKESPVLILIGKYKEGSNGINTFTESEEAMKAFEKNMYNDWGSILFPNNFSGIKKELAFQTKPVTDEYVLAETYRFAAVPETNQLLSYGWVLNYIVVATSERCLMSAMEDLYSIH